MQTKGLQLRRPLHAVQLVLLLSMAGMTKLQAQNITFADAHVKAICVANWDTNNDGELNQAEAAAVTSLDGLFMFDDEITTFDELWFFIGLTSIGEDEFNSCTSLTAISIPKAVTSIGNYAFSDCSSLALITIYAFTPPTLGSYVFDNVPSTVTIKVPNGTSELYQTTIGWDGFIHYEEFIYGLWPISFVDENVKAICVTQWDTNGNGELSYDEAAAVTNIGTYFKSTAIALFDELEYFTSLTSIPNTAFYGCTSLASITLPPSVSALGNGSFYNCTNLATMTVYAETPPTVGTNAFKNVPTNMVVHVPCGTYNAYHNANGWSAFANIQDPGLCPIVFADVNVKALCVANWDTNGDGELSYAEATVVTDLGAVFQNNGIITSFDELQYFRGLSSINYEAFYRCTGLTSIEIPNSVTSIGSNAFYNCYSLTSIEIPNSVISIGNEVFYGCSCLTSIEIPNSVTSIGSNVFVYCFGLEQIVVDSGNTVYDSRNGCNAIIETNTNELVTGCKNTIIPNSVTSIGDGAFFYCTGLIFIEIPNSVVSIGNSAFCLCTDLISIEIPNSVTSIGSEAFYGCSSLTSIEIPNSVTSIESMVFYSCSSLTSIEIPNSVTSIDSYAFYICTGLTSIEIPNSVTLIGNNAFWECTGLTSIEIPNSVTSIGDGAFCHCTGLTSIEIPNSVTSIGSDVFFHCTGLTSIEIPNSVTSIGNRAFGSCIGLEQIIVDSGNTVYDSRNGCNAVIETNTNELVTGCKNTIIPNSVTSIGNGAFFGCTDLISIGIPNSVTSIGCYAYYDCTSLTSIEIPNSVTSIGCYAYYNCTGLTSLTVLADNPPTFNPSSLGGNNIPYSSVFYNVNKSIPVYISCASLYAYQNAPGWNEFTNYTPTTECDSGEITATTNPIEGGMVTGMGFYEGGTICTLIATANTNYAFVNWTKNGEVVSNSEIYNFNVSGNASLVANFSTIPPTPVTTKYYPEPNEPNSPYVKVNWAPVSFETQIGEGSFTFQHFPFYTYFSYSIAENLFLARELLKAGVTSSPMTSLSWYATNAPGYEQQGISIWMANVSDTELTTTSHTVNDMTLVYTGIMTPEIGWNEFVFNEGTFAWDGHSNVLIFCQRNNGEWNSSVQWQSNYVDFYASSYSNKDSEPYNVNETNTVNTCTNRPNIIMKSDGLVSYNLYRANCDGMGAKLIAENLNDTQYIDGIWWQLENGSYKYGVSVADSNNTEIFWSNCIEKLDEVEYAEITATANLNEGGTVTGSDIYSQGATATLTAIPNQGYTFINWTKDGNQVSTETTYSFTVTESATYVANFSRNTFHFITPGTWSISSNWQGGTLPETNDEVFIDAPCQLDQNATVAALTVSDGQSLTLQSGKTLNVTDNLTNSVAAGLVIEDGAQLIHNVANVQATVKKLITPFNGTSDSWHLIALPLTGSSNVASVTNLLEGEYDLYGYDEATTYWKNRKTTGSGFTVLQATKGYLYANGEEVTLEFSGTLENGSATITVPLSFTDGAHLSGFNLIGNPFPCNAYLNREYYVLTTDGTDINPEPIPATTPIPPCTAVFVKAVAEGETVVFTRVAP